MFKSRPNFQILKTDIFFIFGQKATIQIDRIVPKSYCHICENSFAVAVDSNITVMQ